MLERSVPQVVTAFGERMRARPAVKLAWQHDCLE